MRAAGWVAWMAALGLLAGCRSNACREQTLLLTLTLQGTAMSATALQVSVSIAGGAVRMQTVSTHGQRVGNLEVDFPSGYPRGKTVQVTVAAVANDSVLGTATGAELLSGGCGRLPLTIGGGGGTGGDGGSPGGGDGGGDMTGGGCTPTVASCPADACGRVSDGCSGFVQCATPCQVNAVTPRLANSGDTVVIDGLFSGTTTVDFPGAPGQPATLLGATRATVAVPATATAGALQVDSGNTALPAGSFRRASYTLGIATPYRPALPSPAPQNLVGGESFLPTGRYNHAAVEVDGALLVIGGHGPLRDVQKALVNADGTLGGFYTQTAMLTVPRQNHVALRIGGIVHVIGGDDDTSPITVGERATVQPGATLGAFTSAGEPPLLAARASPSVVVAGASLYVIGGRGATAILGSIEQAPIQADGSLGSFTTSTSSLVQARYGAGVFATRSAVYVVGGTGNSGTLATIEAAPIQPDGTLGAFAPAGGMLTDAQPVQATLVIGGAAYVVGTQTLERAAIASDGSLGMFSASGVLEPGVSSAATLVRDRLFITGGYSDGVLATARPISLDASGDIGTFTLDGVHKLAEPRSDAVAFVAGQKLYILGGRSSATDVTNRVQACTFAADDSLTSCDDLSSTVTLAAARSQSAGLYAPYVSTTAGSGYLFLVGGLGLTQQPLATSESATVNPDGSLSAFRQLGISLNTPRYGHRLVDGNIAGMCALGGNSGTAVLQTKECAPETGVSAWSTPTNALNRARSGFGFISLVNGDYAIGGPDHTIETVGTATVLTTANVQTGFNVLQVGVYTYLLNGGQTLLDRSPIDNLAGTAPVSFTTYAASQTSVARTNPAAVVIGNRVYVLGGAASNAPLDSIESAPLQ